MSVFTPVATGLRTSGIGSFVPTTDISGRRRASDREIGPPFADAPDSLSRQAGLAQSLG